MINLQKCDWSKNPFPSFHTDGKMVCNHLAELELDLHVTKFTKKKAHWVKRRGGIGLAVKPAPISFCWGAYFFLFFFSRSIRTSNENAVFLCASNVLHFVLTLILSRKINQKTQKGSQILTAPGGILLAKAITASVRSSPPKLETQDEIPNGNFANSGGDTPSRR